MFFKSHFCTVLTSVLSIFMGLVMALCVIFLNHLPLTWVTIFELWAEIFWIVFIVSMFVPYNKWGDKFASLFHLKEGTVAFALVQGIIPSVVLNSFNTFICTAASIFYNPEIPQAARMNAYIHGSLTAWIPCFIVSYGSNVFLIYSMMILQISLSSIK